MEKNSPLGYGDQAKPSDAAFEADDGPLTADEFDALQVISSAALPNGRVVQKESLF